MVNMGFIQSKSDYSLFTKQDHGKCVYVLVYVDDLLIIGDDVLGINTLKTALDTAFTIKDLGLARYFLGLELSRSTQGIFLNQRKYTLDILFDAGITAAKPAKFPLPKGLKLSTEHGAILPDAEPYRRLIWRLLYMNITRPDISYATQHLSQFL